MSLSRSDYWKKKLPQVKIVLVKMLAYYYWYFNFNIHWQVIKRFNLASKVYCANRKRSNLMWIWQMVRLIMPVEPSYALFSAIAVFYIFNMIF